jgi:hypothetical protein
MATKKEREKAFVKQRAAELRAQGKPVNRAKLVDRFNTLTETKEGRQAVTAVVQRGAATAAPVDTGVTGTGATGVTGTGATGVTGTGATGVTGGSTPVVMDPKVIDQIKKLYPQYSFFFQQGAGGFGDDLLQLLIRASAPGANYTTERFNSELAQTAYFNETTNNARTFDKQTEAQRDAEIEVKIADIRATYGDLFNDPAELRRVATAAARQGLTGNRLKSFVFASASKIGAAPGIAKTAEADKLRNTVREYGYPITDEEVNAVLTGNPYKGQVYTEATLLNKAKQGAKGLYAHLAPQIDAGLSLDDIFKNYRAYASQILELDPNEIDFVSDPKWADAFGDAKQGQLSLSAWQQKLKSEDKYGWKFTNQANQQVSGVVSTLERAFGLVR